MRFDADVAAIGGGASGLMCALSALETNPGARVVVLERQSRVGRKLLATGNGKCNLLNMNPEPARYHGEAGFLSFVSRAYPPDAVLGVFRRAGVEPNVEPGGRVYPRSEQASSVLDALRFALAERGAVERCDSEVISLAPEAGGVRVTLRDGGVLRARRVVACVGSPAAPKLGGSAQGVNMLRDAGHAVAEMRPALTTLQTDPALVRPLKGIRCEVNLRVESEGEIVDSARGEIIFADYGLSGLATMAVSRAAGASLARKRRTDAVIDLTNGDAYPILRARRENFPARPISEFLTGYINKRLGQTLVKIAALPFGAPCSEIRDADLRALARLLGGWRIPIRGTAGFENAQVASGGVRLSEVDPETLASRRVPNLYLAGEALNLDGDCGGYNLYWAWASALLAGREAARF